MALDSQATSHSPAEGSRLPIEAQKAFASCQLRLTAGPLGRVAFSPDLGVGVDRVKRLNSVAETGMGSRRGAAAWALPVIDNRKSVENKLPKKKFIASPLCSKAELPRPKE